MTNNNLSPLNSKNSNTTLLYVVQRCWHSGPQQYQPLDFLRLFRSQRDAEEAAYHSAHAWSRSFHGGRDAPIKTLMLPSYPDHNPQGSSYGFVACGTLFWVRALKATMVTARHHSRTTFGDRNNCLSAAYAVVTEGVIGGTGNRNSRRGTEVCEGRVFGGDASSHKWAVEALRMVEAGFRSEMGIVAVRDVEIKLLPIGRPDEYSSGAFLKDWPPQVLQPSHAVVVDSHSLQDDKRQHEDDDFWVTQEEEGMVVDCPFEMPAAKRRRFDGSHGATPMPPALVTPDASMGDVSAGPSDGDATMGATTTVANNNSLSMFQGTASGGLMVMRGGVFVGATTTSPSAVAATTNHGGAGAAANDDVAMAT